jgi:hypothetical protein
VRRGFVLFHAAIVTQSAPVSHRFFGGFLWYSGHNVSACIGGAPS